MTASRTGDGQDGLVLTGLDGTTPLGFLAALGAMRVVSLADGHNPVRMSWEPSSGTWVARLFSSATDENALLDLLEQLLVRSLDQHPLGRLLTREDADEASRKAEMRRQACGATYRDHLAVDWLAAMASDAVAANVNNQLQTARRDYFKGNLASVLERTERGHLERSLFHTWDYADALDNQSLHLDPSEDRRHAHQWNQPSGDPDRKKFGGMLGANRLAIEAWPIFVSLPEGDRLHTLGFSGFRSDDTRWSWPLWQHPIDLETIRSLLTVPEVQYERPAPEAIRELRERGVVAVFRTRRILVGKTPNFTPAERVA